MSHAEETLPGPTVASPAPGNGTPLVGHLPPALVAKLDVAEAAAGGGVWVRAFHALFRTNLVRNAAFADALGRPTGWGENVRARGLMAGRAPRWRMRAASTPALLV